MRVLAVTSGDAVQGAFSDDAEEIGQITAEGTIGFILIAGMFFGAIGGWLYALLRPILPADRRRRSLACAVVAAAIGASVLVKPGSRDFAILRPLWLVVALFVAIPFLFGLVLPMVAERLRRFYETAPLRFPHVLAFAPMLLLLPGFFVLVPGLVIGVIYALTRARRTPGWLVAAERVGLVAATVALTINGVVQITQLEGRDPTPADFVEPVFD